MKIRPYTLLITVLVVCLGYFIFGSFKEVASLYHEYDKIPSMCSIHFFSGPAGPQFPLPEENTPRGLIQPFVSPGDKLVGMEIWLNHVSPPPTGATILFRLYDRDGKEIRNQIIHSPPNGFATVQFEPIEAAMGKSFFFSLSHPRGSKPFVAAQATVPNVPAEYVAINSHRLPYSILFTTLHPVRWPIQKLVKTLEHFKIPIFLLIILAGVLGFRLVSYRILYLLIFLTGLYTTFAFMPYSKTDEDAHFDYVNALTAEHKLPLMAEKYGVDDLRMLTYELGNLNWEGNHLWFQKRYIAVHPPLYYAAGAVLATAAKTVTSSMAVRFYLLRLLGCASLIVTALYIVKTYELLIVRGAITRHDLLFLLLSSTFILSPGYQTILIPITNDQFTVPLMSIGLYLLVKEAYEVRPRLGFAAAMAAITAALFLTKVTSIFIAPVTVGFLVVRRSLPQAVWYCVISLLLVSPWLYFNYQHYGALVGVRENLQIVSKTIDTDHSVDIRSVVQRSHLLITDYLTSYDPGFPFKLNPMITKSARAGWAFLVYMSICYCVLAATGWRRMHFLWGATSHSERNAALMMIAILATSLAMLMTASVVFSTDLIYNRYTYMMVVASVFTLYIFVQRIIAASGNLILKNGS